MTNAENNSQVWAVIGPPGTGKTTWLASEARALVEWSNKRYGGMLKTPVMLCSLTRAAAAEIAGRDLPLPLEAVGTLHAHAFRALGNPRLVETNLKDFNESQTEFTITTTNRKNTDDPDWETTGIGLGDQAMAAYHVLRARMVHPDTWPITVKHFAKIYNEWKADAGLLDFTDLIEQAWRDVDTAPGAPLVMLADECQDNSALEFSLLKKWGQAAGKLIVVGDPFQALYCWRGAHPEVFMDDTIPNTHRKVLGQSYRVPRAVHRASLQWIKGLSTYKPIEYKPRDYDGVVTTCDANWKAPEIAVNLAEKYLDQGKSVMIMASCSFLMVPTVEVIRKRGLPFSNPWRTRRGDWNPLSRGRGITMTQRILEYLRLDKRTYGDDYRLWTPEELFHWVDVLNSRGLFQRGSKTILENMAKQKEQQAMTGEELRDMFEAPPFREMLELFQKREQDDKIPLDEVLAWWENRVRDKKKRTAAYPLRVIRKHGVDEVKKAPKLFVGTIHSFKGSQADCVFVYPDLSPSGYREWSCFGTSRDSVVRMFYVGLTRARETVVVCNPLTSRSVNLRMVV